MAAAIPLAEAAGLHCSHWPTRRRQQSVLTFVCGEAGLSALSHFWLLWIYYSYLWYDSLRVWFLCSHYACEPTSLVFLCFYGRICVRPCSSSLLLWWVMFRQLFCLFMLLQTIADIYYTLHLHCYAFCYYLFRSHLLRAACPAALLMYQPVMLLLGCVTPKLLPWAPPATLYWCCSLCHEVSTVPYACTPLISECFIIHCLTTAVMLQLLLCCPCCMCCSWCPVLYLLRCLMLRSCICFVS